jgi:hypothetical protein
MVVAGVARKAGELREFGIMEIRHTALEDCSCALFCLVLAARVVMVERFRPRLARLCILSVQL